MRQLKHVLALGIAAGLLAISMTACGEQDQQNLDLSNVRQIAKLSTLECTYHNVARYGNEANDIPVNLIKFGYKKYWFEYDAEVEVGVDVMQIEFVDVPEGDGVVTMTMPDAELLTEPNIIETTMTEPISESGFATDITDDDKQQALRDAQEEVRAKAGTDDALKFQAKERAKNIVEQYVKNVGEELGHKYTVRFINPEDKNSFETGASSS